MWRLSRRRRRDENGAAAVEFALVLIPLMVIVMGLIQYGWYFYVAQTASGATTTVARKMEVGDCWSSGAALSFAMAQSGAVTGVVKLPAQNTSPAVGTSFTVTTTANGEIIGFLPMPSNGIITRSVTAQVEDDQATTC